MAEHVYGFDGASIDALAGQIASALGIRLYEQRSPMIGPWYSSQDPADIQALLQQGQPLPGLPEQNLTLTLNDPEPGYTSPEVPGAGTCLLHVSASPAALRALQQRLDAARLPYRLVSPGQATAGHDQ